MGPAIGKQRSVDSGVCACVDQCPIQWDQTSGCEFKFQLSFFAFQRQVSTSTSKLFCLNFNLVSSCSFTRTIQVFLVSNKICQAKEGVGDTAYIELEV